ncbi:MAG: hypothetical protein LBS57_07425 [Treponema sp.]|jgi:hypothetical protein|nr:hypothetical protein [Treponema sp.]
MKKLLTKGMMVLAALLILSACGAELEGEYLSDYEFVGTGCTNYDLDAGQAVEWKFDKSTMTQTVYDNDLETDSVRTVNYETNKDKRTITLKGAFTFPDGSVYDGSPISYKRGTYITFTCRGASLPFKYGTYFPEEHKRALFEPKLLGKWGKGSTTIEFKENGQLEIKNHNHSGYNNNKYYSYGLPSDSDNLNKLNKCQVEIYTSRNYTSGSYVYIGRTVLLLTIKGYILDSDNDTFGSGYTKQYWSEL